MHLTPPCCLHIFMWRARFANGGKIPGLNVGDNPAHNLTGTVVGYDARSCTYPAEQAWNNALAETTIAKAKQLLPGVAKLLTLPDIRGISMAHEMATQLHVLTQAYAAGNLLLGPMLGYCYVNGDSFYMHTDPGSPPHLMPKFRLKRTEAYDCYEHVVVALDGIRRVVQEFGCLDVVSLNVRGSQALVPQAEFHTDSNKAKIQRFFGRCQSESPLNGFPLAYLTPQFLQQREYQYLVGENMPHDDSQFFIDDTEHISYFATAKWQYFWAFTRDERGGLSVYKICGHRTEDGAYAPTAAERINAAFCRVHGRPANETCGDGWF